MTAIHYTILAAGTVLWFLPFLLVRRKSKGALTLERRARWGVALQGLSYTVLWQGPFWTRSLASWQTAFALALFAIAGAISWTSAFTLGRQLRVDAALEVLVVELRRGGRQTARVQPRPERRGRRQLLGAGREVDGVDEVLDHERGRRDRRPNGRVRPIDIAHDTTVPPSLV